MTWWSIHTDVIFSASLEVVDQCPLIIKDTEVIVREFNPQASGVDLSQPPKIRVSDLPGDVDKEILQMYFENKRHFGKVGVESVELDQTSASAVITFDKGDGNSERTVNCTFC